MLVSADESPGLRGNPPAPACDGTLNSASLYSSKSYTNQFAWLIARNIVGWVLILLALPIGIALPIPLGLPMFMVGFAMVSFPGKRKLAIRVLRGIPLALDFKRYRFIELSVAVAVSVATITWYVRSIAGLPSPFTIAIGLICFFLGWGLTRCGLLTMNVGLRMVPKARKRLRPWLRRNGIIRVHPRAGVIMISGDREMKENILGMQQSIPTPSFWKRNKRTLKTIVGAVVTVAIFAWMFKPVVTRWDKVHERISQINLLSFALASVMFALFLFVFRVISWRAILAIWNRPIPLAPAARIWSTSELARYLPGVIWQVMGRVYLVKPYGVSATLCSTSQVLELTIFLLANLIMALVCMPWFVTQLPHDVQVYFYFAWPVAILLVFLLHPKILYGILDRVMRLLGKPPVPLRMTGKQLLALLAWATLGLLWQGIAVWVLLGQKQALGLSFSRLGLILGTYSLAWCAGFLAVWAPAGVGPREYVLQAALAFALGKSASAQFTDPDVFKGFLTFLVVLMRLWTIAGEIILSSIAYISDYQGALGRDDAPGRQVVATPANVVNASA